MPKLGDLTLKGMSGAAYVFEVYPFDTDFRTVPAVYAVTRRSPKLGGGFEHDIIYIGQTGNLPERFEGHHNAACFRKHQANCICVHQDSIEIRRLAKERDLLQTYSPPCNG